MHKVVRKYQQNVSHEPKEKKSCSFELKYTEFGSINLMRYDLICS